MRSRRFFLGVVSALFLFLRPGGCDDVEVDDDTNYFMQRTVVRREEWVSAPPKLQDGELIVFGEVVMSDAEDAYMRALVDQLMRTPALVDEAPSTKRILEIGFGMGISAGHIRSHDSTQSIREQGAHLQHVVVEPNRDIFASCLSEATNRTKSSGYKLTPLFGFWEDVVPLMRSGSFDGILFDPFPSAITVGFMKQAHRLLKRGGTLTFYLRQPGDSAAHFWDLTRNELIETGFDPAKISVDFMTTRFKSECGDLDRKCSNATITFVVPGMER